MSRFLYHCVNLGKIMSRLQASGHARENACALDYKHIQGIQSIQLCAAGVEVRHYLLYKMKNLKPLHAAVAYSAFSQIHLH